MSHSIYLATLILLTISFLSASNGTLQLPLTINPLLQADMEKGNLTQSFFNMDEQFYSEITFSDIIKNLKHVPVIEANKSIKSLVILAAAAHENGLNRADFEYLETSKWTINISVPDLAIVSENINLPINDSQTILQIQKAMFKILEQNFQFRTEEISEKLNRSKEEIYSALEPGWVDVVHSITEKNILRLSENYTIPPSYIAEALNTSLPELYNSNLPELENILKNKIDIIKEAAERLRQRTSIAGSATVPSSPIKTLETTWVNKGRKSTISLTINETKMQTQSAYTQVFVQNQTVFKTINKKIITTTAAPSRTAYTSIIVLNGSIPTTFTSSIIATGLSTQSAYSQAFLQNKTVVATNSQSTITNIPTPMNYTSLTARNGSISLSSRIATRDFSTLSTFSHQAVKNESITPLIKSNKTSFMITKPTSTEIPTSTQEIIQNGTVSKTISKIYASFNIRVTTPAYYTYNSTKTSLAQSYSSSECHDSIHLKFTTLSTKANSSTKATSSTRFNLPNSTTAEQFTLVSILQTITISTYNHSSPAITTQIASTERSTVSVLSWISSNLTKTMPTRVNTSILQKLQIDSSSFVNKETFTTTPKTTVGIENSTVLSIFGSRRATLTSSSPIQVSTQSNAIQTKRQNETETKKFTVVNRISLTSTQFPSTSSVLVTSSSIRISTVTRQNATRPINKVNTSMHGGTSSSLNLISNKPTPPLPSSVLSVVSTSSSMDEVDPVVVVVVPLMAILVLVALVIGIILWMRNRRQLSSAAHKKAEMGSELSRKGLVESLENLNKSRPTDFVNKGVEDRPSRSMSRASSISNLETIHEANEPDEPEIYDL